LLWNKAIIHQVDQVTHFTETEDQAKLLFYLCIHVIWCHRKYLCMYSSRSTAYNYSNAQ